MSFSSSSTVVAGRDSLLVERASPCGFGVNCLGDLSTTTIIIIIIVVITLVVIGGCIGFLLDYRARRQRRQRGEQRGQLQERAATEPQYDPSVGRPVQNVQRADAPVPTYNHWQV